MTEGKCHYIPHHAVLKDSATTPPICVVYDCSFRQSQIHPSLNDCLLAGPPMANYLTALLLRFHCHKYGFTADIESFNTSCTYQCSAAFPNSLSKLVRVTAYVLRFMQNLKSQSKKLGTLSIQELDKAKRELIKNCQQTAYCKEIINMQSKPSQHWYANSVFSLMTQVSFIVAGGSIMHQSQNQ